MGLRLTNRACFSQFPKADCCVLFHENLSKDKLSRAINYVSTLTKAGSLLASYSGLFPNMPFMPIDVTIKSLQLNMKRVIEQCSGRESLWMQQTSGRTMLTGRTNIKVW